MCDEHLNRLCTCVVVLCVMNRFCTCVVLCVMYLSCCTVCNEQVLYLCCCIVFDEQVLYLCDEQVLYFSCITVCDEHVLYLCCCTVYDGWGLYGIIVLCMMDRVFTALLYCVYTVKGLYLYCVYCTGYTEMAGGRHKQDGGMSLSVSAESRCSLLQV